MNFCDRDSMIDFLEVCTEKKIWIPCIAYGELVGCEKLSEEKLHSLLIQWTRCVGELIPEKDAAHRMNAGNIFLLIGKSRYQTFFSSASKTFVFDEKTGAIIRTNILMLPEEHAYFLLKENPK